ncbi:MAG TPA: CHAD domain-containing protein [Steroidobacteraceae bacterium]|nr:CHAD domain-containing protein [Steroidobacteraceae bacterium]
MAFLALRSQLAAWMKHEPGARLGTDPEDLHQLRVAVRRIDATLGLFRDQMPPAFARARKTAKSMQRTLGAVRDLDVQLHELLSYCGELEEAERATALPLRQRLETERERARTRMVRSLDSETTRHWLETLERGSVDLAPGLDPAPAAAVMPDLLRRRFRKLRKAVRRLRDDAPMEDFHSVRRRAKQLRYAIECGAEIFGKPAEEMLKSLKRMQTRLGESQDAYVAKTRLAALAATPGATLPPETLFFMGRLAEHHLGVTARAHKTVRRCWRKVRGKRWKALRAHMSDLSAGAYAAESAAQVTADTPEPDPAPAVPGGEAEAVVAAELRTLRH